MRKIAVACDRARMPSGTIKGEFDCERLFGERSEKAKAEIE